MVATVTHSDGWVGIVDDDASIRIAVARFLREHGIRVETFASPDAFLHRRIDGEPRCIVLDVELGDTTGFELQDQLVARGGAPPIIFITAHDEIPTGDLAVRSGACGFLRKPFSALALLTLVREHLGNASSEYDGW